MTGVLTPFVYWAQTGNKISLKVDLAKVKDADVQLDEKKLKFFANGEGARGLNNYGFSIDLHSEIDTGKSDYKVSDRQIDFSLCKKVSARWPRLTSQPQKPPWLKIDFDKWTNEDIDDEEIEEAMRDICQDYPDMYNKLHKEEFGYEKDDNLIIGDIEDLKKVYLVFYNLFQSIGYFYILCVMAVKYYKDGTDSMKDTYENVGNPMKFVQLIQILEIMHPMFGYTKGSVLVTFLQVGGRAFILFAMIEAETRMQTKPVVFYLFIVWSLVEIVRYPYYLSQLFHFDIPLLTWLRYTVWMPLYPLGFLCEGIIVLRNIPYFEENSKFTVNLPNTWNIAFHFPTFMKIYLLALCIPGIFMMMSHMNKVRRKKLSKNKFRRKCS